MPWRVRLIGAGVLLLAGAAVAATAGRQVSSARPGQPFTVITADGRRTLPTTIVGDEAMVSLDDLAAIFQLSIREDRLAGGVTVSHKGRSVILTPGQPLASAAGRIVSLPAPPFHDGHRWLVPVEFIGRALSVIYETRLEVRKSSRLILVGSARGPQEEKTQPAAPEPAAPQAPQLPPPAAGTLPAIALGEARSFRTVVIDPGHGGNDTGVKGANGALEKDITLSIARRLASLLESRLGVRALLTRDTDRAVTLDERAAFANNNMADAFVSLHVNASLRMEPSGAQIYSLSPNLWGDDLRQAEATRQALPTLGGGTREIEMVPWDLAQLPHVAESAALAGAIAEQCLNRVRLGPQPLLQAPLRVLAGANMPAVLVEVGFLTNPDEQRQLVSGAYQDTVAQAIVDGLVRFRDGAGASPAPRPDADAPAGPVRGQR